MKRCAHKSTRGGFTLIEAMVAIGVIGTGVAALFVSLQSGTKVNGAATEMTHAVFLGQEIREWTLKLPFIDPDEGDQGNPPGPDGSDPLTFVDDLDDLMDVTFGPPRDGRGVAIANMPNWSQAIGMTWRDPNDLSTAVANGASDVVRVEVEVRNNNQPVYTTSWIVVKK